MKKILIVLIVSLLSILIIDNNFYCTAQNQYQDNGIWINNVGDKDINVIIKDISIVAEKVKLRRDYDKYAIVTMEVYNTSLDYVDLSNINLKVYQDNNTLEMEALYSASELDIMQIESHRKFGIKLVTDANNQERIINNTKQNPSINKQDELPIKKWLINLKIIKLERWKA